MVFCALIIFRTHLLYEQWKTAQYRLKNMDSIMALRADRETNSQNKQLQKKQHYWSCVSLDVKKIRIYQIISALIFIVWIIATCFFYYRTDPYLLVLICMFTILWAIGIFVTVTTRKTKEVSSISITYPF